MNGENPQPFRISVAGRIVAIVPRFSLIRALCRDYLVQDGTAEITVSVSDSDLARERLLAAEDGEAYPPAYLETLAVYRSIASQLPRWDAWAFHGSALAIDGRGVLFTAPSGVGKSTHAALWREVFGSRVRTINDDKPILRRDGSAVWVCGTPWAGKHGLQENTCAPLKAIFLLERGEKNLTVPVTAAQAFPQLLGQSYRPADSAEMMRRTLHLVQFASEHIPVYRLCCTISPEAVQTAYRAMEGE